MPTILVVEDEPAVRKVVCRVLSARGFTVLDADTGAAALIVADGQHIDLLLTDLVLPGMTGPALAKTLRDSRPTLKVLFTSGYPIEDASERFEGVDGGFIGKPYGLEALVEAVQFGLHS